jgi:hypothetical protein
MTETDNTVYRITIEHRSSINHTNMCFAITHSEKIEGRQQADKVADYLRELGFEPDIAVHHEETSAREVIEKFKRHLHDWPVMKELQA